MFGRLRAPRTTSPTARVPADVVVWAIGDVHGRADLLAGLLADVRSDRSHQAGCRTIVIGLGDYVDRGANSRGVLDQLCDLSDDPSIESVFLMGNHEERMEAFLEQPEIGPSWCDYGGRETLASYGVASPAMRGDLPGWTQAAGDLAAALPPRHKALLDGQRLSASVGDYFFCHAGVRPGVPLAEQSADDLLWIRQPFLNHPKPFDQVIVHGHTPADDVVFTGRRIGVDTGAYATNTLSAVRLEGEDRQVVQARGSGATVAVERRALSV